MAQFRYEVWPVPGIGGTYEKKIAALRPESASGTLYRRQSGQGQLSIPAGYDRLDEIITVDPSNHGNDVASLIRVYRGSDLIQELLVPVSPNLVADQPATLSCQGVEAVMDWAIVECWDWDGSADFTSTVPDWIYGGRNLIPDLALGDLGSIREQWELWNDQTPGGTFVLRVTEPSGNPQDTNSLDFDATIQQIEGSNLTGNGLEGLSNVDDVTISGSGQSNDDPWVITFFAPPVIDNLQVFDSGSLVSSLSQTEAGRVDPSPVTVSQSIDASRNPNTHGTYSDPPIEVVTTPLDTGADWSLLVNATGRFAGSQIVLNGVTPGQTYQASIRVRPTITSDFTLVIHDQFENRIKTTTPRDVNLTSGSFQELSISDIQIPEGVTRIIMRVAVVDGTPANIGDFYVNWQGAEFREGQSATTAGQVLLDLLADAQTDHASGGFPRETIDFINAGFDATNDSDANAWADSELSINIPRGMTYRKVLDRVFGQLGYEWNLTPTSGTPGEWDLNVWNPDGRGTDHSAADTPSLLLGQGTLGGSATRQVPQANRIISEGAGQFTTRARNTASEGTIGSREWYQADVSYRGAQAEEWTDKTLARFLDVSLQPRFEIADPPDTEWPIPVVDYGLADILNVDLANGAGKVSRTVEAISWRTVADGIRWGVHTGEAQFDAFPGGGGTIGRGDDEAGGRGAVAVAPQRASVALSGPVDEGVRRLLDQFDRLERPELASAFDPGGKGGAPTVVVAAADASELSKAKADFVCSGSDDQVTINAAIEAATAFGRIILTENNYSLSGSIVLTNAKSLLGLGIYATVLEMDVADDVPIVTVNRGSTIRDLYFQTWNGKGIEVVGSARADIFVENCWFDIGGDAPGIEGLQVQAFTVQRCQFSTGGDGPLILVGNGCRDIWIMNNRFTNGTHGFRALDSTFGSSGLNLYGNKFRSQSEYGISIELTSGAAWTRIIGNLFQTMSGGLADGAAIQVLGDPTKDEISNTGANAEAFGLVISGNQVENGHVGIRLEDLETGIINGNTLEECEVGGLVLDNCILVDATHNQLYFCGDTPDDTHESILLTDCEECRVESNTLVSDRDPATTNLARYGIHIDGGECNIVVANNLGTPSEWATDPIADFGIDTRMKYPDDPVYGDNWVDCEPTPS